MPQNEIKSQTLPGGHVGLFMSHKALLHGPWSWRGILIRWRRSDFAHGDGLGGPDRVVEHGDGKCRLSLLAGQGAGAKLRADQVLGAADGSLDEGAPAVSGRPLLRHRALLGNQPDVAIPRRLGSRVIGARHHTGAWRDDHARWWAMLPDSCPVDGIAVAGATRGHVDDAALHTSEKNRCLGCCVVGVVLGQNVLSDLAAIGVHGDGELAPVPTGAAVLLRVPPLQHGRCQPNGVPAWLR